MNKEIVKKHGFLHVNGIFLEDQDNNHIQLYGMSTYGLGRPEYLNINTFKTLRDDWNTNCIRIALYTAGDSGYCTGDKDEQKELIFRAIDAAIELDMYIMLDWHVLVEGSPLVYKSEAIEFFTECTTKYGNIPNLLYEICNEPNGEAATWEAISEYANAIIPAIRKNAPDAVIICGSPIWSQDLGKPFSSPLPFDNVMYSLHFYAATHKEWLRNPSENYIKNGLPVIIGEFNICTCTGNGELDYEQGKLWKEMIEKYELSFICWNLSNVDETSSILKATTTATDSWCENELNDCGIWIKKWFAEK